jgi:hypothetical protein
VGLDAVVYINRDNLPLKAKEDAPTIDDETGEAYFEDSRFSTRYPKSIFTAVQRNLGNIAEIAALRTEVSTVLGNDSIISNKVLYSGSHSGDRIPFDDLQRLDSEISLVRARTVDTRSTALGRFLESLSELVEAAKKQHNPIVFV